MAKRTGRRHDRVRSVEITPGYLKHPEGSALIKMGDTVVVCTATVEDRVKEWLRGQGRGWITAEYAMLPRANEKRGMREGQFGRWPSGRSQEIQRLIGRSLRGCIWPRRVGERMITIDCDVLQADGGTRTASVTGAFVALAQALHKLKKEGAIKSPPLKSMLAAVSVGILGKEILLDLDYNEDSNADVDLNVTADETGRIVEVQATAEGKSYTLEQLTEMTQLAIDGIKQLNEIQIQALESAGISMGSILQRPEDIPHMKLLVATGNRGKIKEIKALLKDWEVISPADINLNLEVEEDAETFAGNAIKKAAAYAHIAELATLADDSGLEVEALEGAPGVYSARFGGDQLDDSGRNLHLLETLARLGPSVDRTARFRCVLAFIAPGHPEPQIFQGTLQGRIAREPQGEHGFGYDPVFIPEGHEQSLALLGPAVKNEISHRARALRGLAEWLAQHRS